MSGEDAALPLVPIVSLTIVRRVRRLGDRFVIEETDALVWDPTAVRLMMDEKPGSQPLVAVLLRTADSQR